MSKRATMAFSEASVEWYHLKPGFKSAGQTWSTEGQGQLDVSMIPWACVSFGHSTWWWCT